MKRFSRTALAALAAGALLAGAVLPAQAQTTLRLGHVIAPDEPGGLGTQMFAEKVKEYTEGRVSITVFPQAQLGNNRQLFTQVRTGAIDMSITFHSMLADIVPEFSAYVAGYFYRDWDHAKAVLEHPDFGQAWDGKLIADGGLRVLDSFYFGTRNLTTTSTEVRSPADMDGLKIRAVPTDISLAVIGGMGANPTPVPFPELFQALRQGIVDGQENPLPTINAAKFQEVQDYLILTRHQTNPAPWVINEAAWQRIAPADQEAMLRAAGEAAEWTTKAVQEQEEALKAQLAQDGMTVVELTEAERAVFAEAVQASVIEAFKDVWPAGMAEAIINLSY